MEVFKVFVSISINIFKQSIRARIELLAAGPVTDNSPSPLRRLPVFSWSLSLNSVPGESSACGNGP